MAYAAAPEVAFVDAPQRYVIGSGQDLALEGQVERGQDVVVQAWRLDDNRMAPSFSHVIGAGDDVVVSADRLDRLAPGRVQVQLLLRDRYRVRQTVWVNLDVVKPSAALAPTFAFADNRMELAVGDRGVSQPVRLNVSGPLPADCDYMIQAWHEDQDRLVPGFTHVLTGDQVTIDAAKLRALDPGEVTLIAVLRRNARELSRTGARLRLAPVGVAFQNASAWAEVGQAPAIALATTGDADLSASIRDGSGAWSALPLTDAGVVPASALSSLPVGAYTLQAQARINGVLIDDASKAFEVTAPAAEPTPVPDEPQAEEPVAESPQAEGPVVDTEPEAQPEPQDPAEVVTPSIRFANPPDVVVRGDGQTVGVTLNGPMPAGGDVLFQAWSLDQQEIWRPFAHVVSGDTPSVSAAYMAKLPAGRVNLQALLRVDNKVVQLISFNLDVREPAAVGGDPAPETPGNEGNADAGGSTPDAGDAGGSGAGSTADPQPEPDSPDPVVEQPSQQQGEPEAEAEPFRVSFPGGLPAQYLPESGVAIQLVVEGDLPDGADVLIQSWSERINDLAPDFTFTLGGSPWTIPASRLDNLPSGVNHLQAITRLPDGTLVRAATVIEVLRDDEEPVAEAPADEAPQLDLPTDESGWTQYKPHPDAQVYYVSKGQNANDALRKVRAGKGDWVLLERGGEYQLDNRTVVGRSAEYPAVIGAYGDVSKPRPLLVDDNFDLNESRHVALLDLDFYAKSRDPYRGGFREDDAPKQIGLTVRNSKNIRIEGCRLRFLSRGVEVQRSEDVTFYRTVMFGNWSANRFGGKFQAQYCEDLRIIECVFDHNGWLPKDSAKSGWAHTTYTVGIDGLVMKDNLFTRGSNVAMRAGSGAEYEQTRSPLMSGNIVADHFTGLSMSKASYVKYDTWPSNKQARGVVDAMVTANVFTRIGARDVTGNMLDEAVALALNDNTRIENNYFIHKTNGSRDPINWSVKMGRVIMKGNIMHDYGSKRNKLWQSWGGGASVTDSGNLIERPDNEYRDPSRDLVKYAKDRLGLSYDNMCRAMVEQRKGDWKPALTAPVIRTYIAQGFDRSSFD
ncbi:MAG: hypothetical protein AAF612_06380 [Planctomycetota bacterium]